MGDPLLYYFTLFLKVNNKKLFTFCLFCLVVVMKVVESEKGDLFNGVVNDQKFRSEFK